METRFAKQIQYPYFYGDSIARKWSFVKGFTGAFVRKEGTIVFWPGIPSEEDIW